MAPNAAPNTPEPEFEQAKDEVFSTLKPFFDQHPEYLKAWEIVQNPEKIIQFR